jgi:hypothetical protein
VQRIAQLTPCKAHGTALDRTFLHPLRHEPLHLAQQPPCLRRQFVQRTPKHLVRQTIRQDDVRRHHLDVLDRLAGMRGRVDRALMLMQQRNRIDQRQILRVIAPQAHAITRKRQVLRKRIHDGQRPQQLLRRPMRRKNVVAARLAHQPG